MDEWVRERVRDMLFEAASGYDELEELCLDMADVVEEGRDIEEQLTKLLKAHDEQRNGITILRPPTKPPVHGPPIAAAVVVGGIVEAVLVHTLESVAEIAPDAVPYVAPHFHGAHGSLWLVPHPDPRA